MFKKNKKAIKLQLYVISTTTAAGNLEFHVSEHES